MAARFITIIAPTRAKINLSNPPPRSSSKEIPPPFRMQKIFGKISLKYSIKRENPRFRGPEDEIRKS